MAWRMRHARRGGRLIKRLERGLLGDVEPVGQGVSELRIHGGPGWRVCFTQRGAHLVILLHGGASAHRKRISNVGRVARMIKERK